MDLYRALRLSLYALALSGALALSIAERDVLYVLAVLFLAGAAHFTLDSGRYPPARPLVVFALALALLVYDFLPLRSEEAWRQSELPLRAFAEFLCIFQALLFFLAYRGAILLGTGVGALALVIISGVLDLGASLFLRMAVFVAVSAWALQIHALWRTHEDFASQYRLAMGAGGGSPPALLSDRALGQGLALTALLAAAGLALGLVLFFSAPRVNETLTGWLEVLVPPPQAQTPGGKGPAVPVRMGPGPDGGEWQGGLDLNALGPVHSNRSPAVTVTFSQLGSRMTNGGIILLRGNAADAYSKGVWQDAPLLPPEALRLPGDPSAPGIKPRGAEFKQSVVCNEALQPRACFAAGPVSRISVLKVAQDAEGILHAGDGKPITEPYDIWSYPPVRADDLPDDAEAVHPDRGRYVRDGLPANVRTDVLACALRITKNDATALKKVRSIVSHLRSSGRYAYTLRLDELKRTGEPLADFLLSDDPLQRRGHCGYFASALVVLCRLNNLPARLVSGFAAPLPADAPADGPQQIVFRNSDAHAWVEVFFKDYGWVAFDPTPPAPPDAVPTPPVAVTPPSPPTVPPKPESWLQEQWGYVMNYSGKDQRAWVDRIAMPLRDAGSVFSPGEGGGWIGPLLAWVAAVGLVMWLMQAFLRHGRRRTGRLSASAARTQAALAFYNDLLHVLSRRGFVRKPGQTPREFAEHVVRHGGQSFGAVLVVTDVFESVRYGGVEINQDEFNRLQTALDSLRELTFASAQ